MLCWTGKRVFISSKRTHKSAPLFRVTSQLRRRDALSVLLKPSHACEGFRFYRWCWTRYDGRASGESKEGEVHTVHRRILETFNRSVALRLPCQIRCARVFRIIRVFTAYESAEANQRLLRSAPCPSVCTKWASVWTFFCHGCRFGIRAFYLVRCQELSASIGMHQCL